MFVRGSVDSVTSTEIQGWAYAPGQSGPVMVQAVLHHEILGEAVANIHRPDLAAAGLGDGRLGYSIKLHREIDPLYLPFLSVKLDGGDAELPRANASGFGEFFAALYRAHPAAGRTRSVFGGLWTDRIDAAAVLRSKANVGHVAPEAADVISKLIHDGVAIIDSRGPLALGFAKAGLAERVGAVLDDEALLSVLWAVLEDNPLVVKAETIEGEETEFSQPSTENPSPSCAECLALAVALAEGVTIETVRESHKLPEFTPTGVSRWVDGTARTAVEMAAKHGIIDGHSLSVGSVAVIAPGSLYRLRCGDGSEALQLLCLPARLMPLKLATDSLRHEVVHENGVRVLV